jgi:hypothetical protein
MIPVPIALRGIPWKAAVSGSWAIAMPPSALMKPRPSEPLVPDRTIAIARSPWPSASERKDESTGCRCPRGAVGLFVRTAPSLIFSS